MTNETDILKQAIESFGEGAQVVKAAEEFAELIVETMKFCAGAGNKEKLAEEIADAQIMIDQLTDILVTKHGLDENAIDSYRRHKLERLERTLKGRIK